MIPHAHPELVEIDPQVGPPTVRRRTSPPGASVTIDGAGPERYRS